MNTVVEDRTVKETEKRAEIYLTEEEIDAMYNLELSGENEIVRDIFVLGYFSCQRYSDYGKLREENFMTYDKGLGMITLTQKKKEMAAGEGNYRALDCSISWGNVAKMLDKLPNVVKNTYFWQLIAYFSKIICYLCTASASKRERD